ncbi:MAG: heme ABC exporter ATP-binding protein CcmA [Acidobacteria bacterium]|nr:MAG: heme ABC exporter ATP-binding protein CcmA [Acidobacteriota bacterium]
MPASPAPAPLVRLVKLTRKFGPVTAVRNVDLEIRTGDFIAIFGPNGAGKTTLLKMVASLLSPTSGKVVFSADGSSRNRSEVGYVSHQTLLYNELTGRENLAFYGRLYSLPDPDNAASEMLLKMGLREAADLAVRGYSRGMKQRLTLGRALLHEPRLILLDEPYTGLDQHGSRILTEMLRSLREEGRTVLMITHSLAEGLELCTRVLIQHRGRLVFQSDRDAVDRAGFENLYFQTVER